MKNIFITGASGYIGREICKTLVTQNHNITAIGRNAATEISNVDWHKYDILNANKKSLLKLLENKEVIIHNAASLLIGNTDAEINEIEKINVKFTKLLLECAVEKSIKKIIFTSTLSSIKKPLPNCIYEESKIECLHYYSKSKILGEKLVQEFALKYNLNYNILRISSPIDNNFLKMPNTVVKKWISQSINKQNIQVFGNGNRTQDFVATTDIANVFLSCVENNVRNGIYNIASGNSISMLQLANIITHKFGNSFDCIGKDINENDRWNISIDKAKKELNFTAKYTSTSVIEQLLNTIA